MSVLPEKPVSTQIEPEWTKLVKADNIWFWGHMNSLRTHPIFTELAGFSEDVIDPFVLHVFAPWERRSLI